MRRPVLVCYDVFDDVRRTRLRQALNEVADRFQQSGWLIPSVAGFDAEGVTAALGEVLAPLDRLRVYSPCPACAREARTLPEANRPLVTGSAWIAD